MLTAEMKAQGWQDMAAAPRDGTMFVVCYREWNVETNPLRYQIAQSLPPLLRSEGGLEFHQPWNPCSGAYADAWIPLDKFIAYRPEKPND
jgi:hypothetical protein